MGYCTLIKQLAGGEAVGGRNVSDTLYSGYRCHGHSWQSVVESNQEESRGGWI